MFIHPIPLPSLESRNMDTESDAEFFGNNFLKILHRKLVISPEIRKVKKYLASNSATVLDIGCGTGWTTSIWKENGFQPVGLESSQARAEIAQKRYGIPTELQHIENYQPSEKFDVAIMRHLLEHIEHPARVLEKVRGFLKDDGLIVVVIPNINSIGRFIFEEKWEWVLPWHLHFYTPKTLSALLEKCGYEKICVYQTPSPLWYPNCLRYALGENSRLGKLYARIPLILQILPFVPILLCGMLLNLNDNMTLIFKRKS